MGGKQGFALRIRATAETRMANGGWVCRVHTKAKVLGLSSPCVQGEPVVTTRRVAWILDGHKWDGRNLCLVDEEDSGGLRKHI